MKFDIQFDEVRKIAIQIEELAHKLAAETSKEGSRDENSIYVYSAEDSYYEKMSGLYILEHFINLNQCSYSFFLFHRL